MSERAGNLGAGDIRAASARVPALVAGPVRAWLRFLGAECIEYEQQTWLAADGSRLAGALGLVDHSGDQLPHYGGHVGSGDAPQSVLFALGFRFGGSAVGVYLFRRMRTFNYSPTSDTSISSASDIGKRAS